LFAAAAGLPAAYQLFPAGHCRTRLEPESCKLLYKERKRQFLSFNIGIKSFLVVSADTPDHGIPLKKFEYRGANGKPRLTGFD
jgi:hypothetical protein